MSSQPLAQTELPISSPETIWENCLDIIRPQITTLSFKTWFQPVVAKKFEQGALTVQVPSQFFYDWLEEHYRSLISKTIESVLGPEGRLFYSIASDDQTMEPFVEESTDARIPLGQ